MIPEAWHNRAALFDVFDGIFLDEKTLPCQLDYLNGKNTGRSLYTCTGIVWISYIRMAWRFTMLLTLGYTSWMHAHVLTDAPVRATCPEESILAIQSSLTTHCAVHAFDLLSCCAHCGFVIINRSVALHRSRKAPAGAAVESYTLSPNFKYLNKSNL